MVISWLGQSCFKIQSGDLTLVIDPFSKEIGLTPPRFRTDVVLVTHNHPDHSNHESLGGEPFLVSGPGEYETKGIYIHGVETFHDREEGKEHGMNTAYKFNMEQINLVHLGDLGEEKLRDKTLEELGDVDVLMIPVGGKVTIGSDEAAKIIKQIEPRFVIPMHYKIPGLSMALEPVDSFLKEMGTAKIQAEDKLVLKKKDFAEEGKTEVKLLTPAK